MPFAGGKLPLLTAYSELIRLYGVVCALYLTSAAAYGAFRRVVHSEAMLAGALVFDTALIMDVLLPNFEPVLTGWFLEWAGGALALLTGVAMGQELVRRYRESLVTEGKIESVTRLVELQRAYYPVILEGIREARTARHDLRHHMRMVRELAAGEDMDGLAAYLAAYRADKIETPTDSFCQNYVADTLLRHFAALSAREGVRFEARADLPEVLLIDDADFAALLSNLLENALEASMRVAEEERYIRVAIRQVRDTLGIEVRNRYDGVTRRQSGRPLSAKRAGREGVGVASVRETVARYGGLAEFTPDARQKEFRSEVVLHLTSD
jgi:hypothetical protein